MSARVQAAEKAEADKARKWLEDTLGLEVGEDFFVALGDGVLLCSIINTIKPGTINKVNPPGRAKKLPPKRMENINNFIFGARKLGMLKSQLFEMPEFLEKKRHDRLVKCVLFLAELAKKNGIDRSAASNVLASAAQLDEADAKKQKEAEAADAARIKEDEDRVARIAEQMRKDREAGKLSEEEFKGKQEAAKKEKEERDKKYAEEKEERDRKAKLEAIRKASEAERKAAASDRPAAAPSRFDSGPARTLYGVDAILYWLQQSTYGYEDFTKSWKDGLAFCALIHRHAPKELDFAAFKNKTPAERLEAAFETAGRLGAPPLLDPEDVWDIDTPERRSMITYFGVLYKAFGPK